MKDNQKKYLDKVVGLIVSDTDIDYDNDRIRSPFFRHHAFSPYSPLLFFSSSPFFFYKYCEHTYGLTETEIEYVWDQYRNIIKDKLTTI